MMPTKLYINFILILFVLLACQGEDLIDDRVDPKIRVLDSFESIQLGVDKTISLAYFNIVGNRIDSPDFKWESSDTSVLVVSSDGIINAVGVGEATITVSIQTFEGKTLTQTFDIKVNVEPNLKITTDVPSSILKGDQLDIEFSFVDSITEKELQPESIEWTSQDDKVIAVDENGKITGVEIGRTTIVLSITFEGDTKEQEIELSVIVTPELKIESSDTTIIQNQTLTLNSVFNGSDGQPKDGVEISYTSSNTDIITVDINGKVTAIRKGVAEITGKVIFEGMVYEDKISFNVNLEPKITLTETVNAITEGNSLKFNATFFDENGEENIDVTFTWKTANTESLKVEQNGTITAIQAKDSAIITVSVQYNGETYTEEFAIEIKAKPIEPILEITQKPNTLEHDAEYKVEFTFT
ncbi:MAG: Ig-like domain-containing protein, partial [Flavobacteriaceae bacterium]|nr:Ig-like domain-containing protein [Flavobacteriaceae bacterium]MCY4253681.1 Ig-like domain-containing protein [Flavobacteriaceae bacterium]